MNISPWLHIITAYLVYIVIAILASAFIRKIAGDLKDFANRNSPRVLLLGAAANLIAMFAVILLLVLWDKQPVSNFGLLFHRVDALASFAGLMATFLMAIGFLELLRRTGHLESLEIQQPAHSLNQFNNMLMGLAVLVAVVLQEEVLNRGYVTINLLSLDPIGIILFSTISFVLIHFLTNRPNLYQTISWIISGLILSLSYLLSGSLWVPVILHYATDATNVLIFNITGQFSFFKTNPILSEGQRVIFRVGYGLVITALLFAIYGLKFKVS